ncbi:conserved exported hypothetical protein [Candidatus Sulfopaludibacter sp. SbA4]|nr:conserved exported hypothetical protein [Candidatus Sulfopaludibacter sp. SbA4]
MKRVFSIALAVAAMILPRFGQSTDPFEEKLSPERQINQALNRLTFGPRPGDVEEVRHIGLAKWIQQQLHPDQIAENPVLEERLTPLKSLRMPISEAVSKYSPDQNMGMMMLMEPPFAVINKLPQSVRFKIMNGTAEERTAALDAMDPELRSKVLAGLPDNVAEHTPKYKDEAEKARKALQDERRAQIRKRNPQLPDLLPADEMADARSGEKDRVMAVIQKLDPDKRTDVVALLPPKSQAFFPEYRREAQVRRTPRLAASHDLKEARMYRAVYSNRQLEEVLVDYWTNHFNVDSTKNVGMAQNLGHVLIGSYERDAIRPHVLGHFRDLLLATARHPAMLYYLDNWESMAPESFNVGPFAPRRGIVNGVPNSIIPNGLLRLAHGLNENYGREIMELHTLGVKGGYTQADVIAVARCFTGWTVRNPENPEFVFAPFMHDFGEKTVLGHRIPADGGEEDGLKAIDILAHHPSTAKFISLGLARHFVADHPPEALVDRMTQTFMKTDGDLRAVMETMFRSPEFFSEGAWEARVKSPLEMAASTIRAMGAEMTDAWSTVQRISDMGQALYAKAEPTGYPDVAETWLGATAVIARMNFGAAVASGELPGVSVDTSRWQGMDHRSIAKALLGHDASQQTLDAIATGLEGRNPSPAVVASLVLGSPDFERR